MRALPLDSSCPYYFSLSAQLPPNIRSPFSTD